MREFIHFMIDPIVVLCVLFVLFLIAQVVNRRRLSSIFLALSLSWFFIVVISPLPQWLVYDLESRYPIFEPKNVVPGAPVNILVLGAGHSSAHLPASGKLGT